MRDSSAYRVTSCPNFPQACQSFSLFLSPPIFCAQCGAYCIGAEFLEKSLLVGNGRIEPSEGFSENPKVKPDSKVCAKVLKDGWRMSGGQSALGVVKESLRKEETKERR
jgi:hypothetical protein